MYTIKYTVSLKCCEEKATVLANFFHLDPFRYYLTLLNYIDRLSKLDLSKNGLTE